jgi:hypothetical protein
MKLSPKLPLAAALLCASIAAAPEPSQAASLPGTASRALYADTDTASPLPGTTSDFHGYVSHDFTVDGCGVHVVDPKDALPGHPWVWRTMFWDAFPNADIALLGRGFSVAFIDVGDTFGCPDAMKHFDAFYDQMTGQYGYSRKPALEGLSRGGLYAYRWAYVNTDKVGCIYGDAPLCDMKSWPEGRGKSTRQEGEVQQAINCYHFKDEAEMEAFTGNPIDILAPIARARIPIMHVVGDADRDAPMDENSDIIQQRYQKMRGPFTLIVKQGCAHHPHGLTDATPVADFIVAHCATGQAAEDALKVAPKAGEIIVLPQGKW